MDADEESKRLEELIPDNPMRGKTATEALPIYQQRRMKRFENSSLHWRLSDARQRIDNICFALPPDEKRGTRNDIPIISYS